MTVLQEIVVVDNLIKLFNMYEKHYQEEVFRRLIYKHIINMPESLYNLRIKYDIKISIEEDSQFRVNFLEDLNNIHHKALVISGLKNVNKMMRTIIDNMGEYRIYNFFKEATQVLVNEEVEQEDKEMIKEMIKGMLTEVYKSLGLDGTSDK